MSRVKDIRLDSDGDLDIVNGDFSLIESDYQHTEDILMATFNHFKNFPTLGANVPSELSSGVNNQRIKRLIRDNLKADRYQVGKVVVNNDIGQKEIGLPELTRLNEPID